MSQPPTPFPLPAGAASAAPTWRAAYSDRTAVLMARLSQIAYELFENEKDKPGQEKGAAGRAFLEQKLGPDFNVARTFNCKDTQGYLAISKDFAVLAFRGTKGVNDFITDFTATWKAYRGWSGKREALENAPPNEKVVVHKGFLDAFESCRAEVTQAVDEFVPPTLGLYITGHSLGGALAQIASAALERDNLAACYTFGSPRVGTTEFDRQVKCPHYRLIHKWDIVPGVPPLFLGFRHSGDPRLLKVGPRLLRRDRWPPAVAWAVVRSIPLALIRRRIFVIDDHMIEDYAADLAQIALERERKPVDPNVERLLKAVAAVSKTSTAA